MTAPRVLILRAPGTNCDEEAAHAWDLAGAVVETRPIRPVLDDPSALDGFQVLTLPGGFSYGDDLGAGVVQASKLARLGDRLAAFRDRGGLILGICNGFQVLVRAGLLPGGDRSGPATLTRNDSARFEARWVRLAPRPGLCPFLADATPFDVPVAHGEGKFLTSSAADLEALDAAGQIVLRYVDDQDRPTQAYPANPNGSPAAVAGVCDPTGRVLGLMPHPERFTAMAQHPSWTRLPDGARGEGCGLRMFRAAVRALA
jgi:phosphoribosylformylglycinamidine synthase